MSATLNGTHTTGIFDLGRPEPSELEKALRAMPTEALGMAIQHHRDEALRLKNTRRSRGMMLETPVGNEALISWHEFLLGSLRIESQRRDGASAV